MSKQRKLIYEIVSTSLTHPTAEEVFLEAKKNCPNISFSTVYRNLKKMAESGEIKYIPLPLAPDRYDGTVMPHEHAICPKCHRFHDLPDLDIKSYIEEKTGARVDSYSLELSILCSECRNSSESEVL